MITKEKALEMIEELLQKEEQDDYFYLTHTDRREFQRIVREQFEEKQPDTLTISTPEGDLRAALNPDPEYPGIYIEIQPNGTDYSKDVVLVEYDSTRQEIRNHLWEDATYEDVTYHSTLMNLDKYKEQIERD